MSPEAKRAMAEARKAKGMKGAKFATPKQTVADMARLKAALTVKAKVSKPNDKSKTKLRASTSS
jgi:hypothetical protein